MNFCNIFKTYCKTIYSVESADTILKLNKKMG